MSKIEKIGILGIGTFVPEKTLSNEDIELLVVGTDAKWTKKQLGINKRQITTSEEMSSDLGFKSAIAAIADANIDKNKIDLIIVATSSPDRISPSTACLIQEKLDICCPAFDVNAVCSGFVYGIQLATSLISTKQYKKVLLIGTETYSKITNWENRDCVFFGDGSGSVIIGETEKGWIATNIFSDGKGTENFTCHIGEKFKMDGKAVFDFAVSVLPNAIKDIIQELNMSMDDIDWVIPHQPSHNIMIKTAEILGIPLNKVIFNMGDFGNTAGASIPMALDKLYKEGKIKDGQILVMPAVGSGMTWGVSVIKYYK